MIVGFYQAVRQLPVAVPPGTDDKVTSTFLARVPFRRDTVTLTLPASSSTE